MNNSKLKEALVELHRQRAMIDSAITNVERVVAMMEDGRDFTPMPVGKAKRASYVDDAVGILEKAGQPLHIKDIAKRIGELRGKPVPRASVESSVIRHIASENSHARITKIRPAIFGLPTWKGLLPLQESSPS